MLRRPENRSTADDFGDQEYERIFLFVTRKLSKQRARVFTDAILAAGARYDRYQAARGEWKSYSDRRARLDKIAKSSEELANGLLGLDVLTRDDLARRLDEGMNQSLVNSLLLLRKEAAGLIKGIQQNGRWRDLAEECWIFELADIYEKIFSRPARVSGSGDGALEQRGEFYGLLTVSLPASFPRHGKLSVKQVDGVLKRRSK
jgi:hypothetical protein